MGATKWSEIKHKASPERRAEITRQAREEAERLRCGGQAAYQVFWAGTNTHVAYMCERHYGQMKDEAMLSFIRLSEGETMGCDIIGEFEEE